MVCLALLPSFNQKVLLLTGQESAPEDPAVADVFELTLTGDVAALAAHAAVVVQVPR